MSTRSSILRQLRSADDWITGDLLSRDLGISRAAVSKQVRALRDSGYSITTVPNRGYRFESAPDLLLADEILPLTTCRTFGKARYTHFHSVGSTNAQAHGLAEDGCPEGTVVVAEEQTEGKGRKGRDWSSPAGTGIYATLVLRPPLPLEDTPLLTLLTGVAAANAIIEATALPATIKWPNDLLVHEKKVAGVLTEVSSDIDRVDFVLIGFGLNVNTAPADLPRRPIFPATSLAAEVGTPQARKEILALWLANMESEYTKLLAGKRKRLLERWKALAGIIGRSATITRVTGDISGTVTDIDSDGALLLKTADGSEHRILSGDVKFDR